jgi:hypothetical protein
MGSVREKNVKGILDGGKAGNMRPRLRVLENNVVCLNLREKVVGRWRKIA